jgi:cyanophycinase
MTGSSIHPPASLPQQGPARRPTGMGNGLMRVPIPSPAAATLDVAPRRRPFRGWLPRLLPLLLPLAMVTPSLSQEKKQAAPPAPAPGLRSLAGSLLICGGGKMPPSVQDRFLLLAGGDLARVVIIPTASRKADTPEVEKVLLPWKGRKMATLALLHTRDRKQADNPAFLKPLSEATGVWLCGGDQKLLTATYGGTAVVRELQRLLARGGVVAGNSAGAAVLSGIMIAGGGSPVPELSEGFGLLPGAIVDQHFYKRSRNARLEAALSLHPRLFGLGVDEDTAALIHGEVVEVLGGSRVALYQRDSNGRPATLSCQVLTPGCRYNLRTRQRLVGD